MHNNFIDKDRRFINLRLAEVKSVLPEYFQETYPRFISLLENYYEFQSENNDATELLSHLFASRDITETDITLLSFIEDELLLGDAYFEGFGQTDAELRAAANFSNVLFRSKGTRFAIEWFFRSFYGLDAEVFYPKENIFKVGEENSIIGTQGNKFLTDDKLYQTWALLIKTSIPISRWEKLFKLFAHPAGMYLAGQVLINGEREVSITGDADSAVATRPTPTYSVSFTDTEVFEGQSWDATITANNLANNFGIGYYLVEHTTTSDSDFPTLLPQDSASPQLFAFDSSSAGVATANISINTLVDSDETEGDETLHIRFYDNELREISSISPRVLTLKDTSIQVDLEVLSATTLDEGETFNFRIVQGTANDSTAFPADGVGLQYYVNHNTTNDDDFVPPVATAASPASIHFEGDSARFSIRTRVDNNSESNETFNVVLQTEQGILKDSSEILTLNNVVPAFTLTSKAVITEGDSDININLVVDETTVGTTVNWTIDSDLNSRLPVTSGSFVITSSDMDVNLTETLSTNTYEDGGNSYAKITLTTTGGSFSPELTDTTETRVDNQDPTFSIATDPLSAKEGETVDVVVTSTNAAPGTYYYYVQHLQTNDADFSVAPPQDASRQSFTHNTQSTTISSAFTYTNTGDPSENYRLYVSDGGTAGDPSLADTFVTISDVALTYTLLASPTTVNEGDTTTLTFTTNDADGTYYYYTTGTGVDANDFDAGYAAAGSRQSFVVSSGTGTFDLTLAEDLTTEGTEFVTVSVAKGLTTGAVVTEVVTVNDTSTSVSSYTVAVSSSAGAGVAKEGLPFDVDITGTDANTLYIEIQDILGARISGTQKTLSFTGGTQTKAFTTLANDPYYGDSTGTVKVATSNYQSLGGTEVGSTTFNMIDASPSYTLTNDLVGDSANEVASGPYQSNTINWTFDGTNVPDGTYRFHDTRIRGKFTTAAYGLGDTRIFLDNTTGLSFGDEIVNSATTGISGTITYVGTTFVDISDPCGPIIGTSGTVFYFAPAGVADDWSLYTTGSFTLSGGTPETGTFSQTLAADADTSSPTETLTVGVYDDAENLLVSRDVNVYDPAGLYVEFSISDPYSIIRIGSTLESSVTASLEFRNDGTIYGTDGTGVGVVPTFLGNWISNPSDPSFNAGDYTIIINDLSDQDGPGVYTGSFGTPLNLGTTQTVTVNVVDPNFLYGVFFSIQIYETSNTGNSDTISSFLVEAEENYSDPDGGPIV